jgi:hypothetical protein
VNGIVKHTLTKFLLDEIAEKVQNYVESFDLQEFVNTQRNWVEQFHNSIEVANHAPKPLTGMSALEVHWPENAEPADRFTINETHERIYNTNRKIVVKSTEVVKKVVAAQTKRAEKYLEKASKKKIVEYGILKVGDKVNTDRETSVKKKTMGKSYFPFSGKIVSVIGKQRKFKIEWGLSPGMGEKSGKVARKRFRRDQLLLCTEENEEITVQLFKNADSWNSYEVKLSSEEVKEVFRERITSKGYLEVLCLLKNSVLPEWKPITVVGDCRPFERYQSLKVSFFLILKLC